MGDETKTAITIYLHGSRRADVTIKYIPVIHSIRDHALYFDITGTCGRLTACQFVFYLKNTPQ